MRDRFRMTQDMKHRLTPETADRFAEIALGHVTREYPHKLDHVHGRAGGRARARARCIRSSSAASTGTAASTAIGCCCGRCGCIPDMPVAPRIRALLDEMLTPDKVAGELAYLDRAYTGGFERPYGWAWLLALHARGAAARGRTGPTTLAPLAARLRRAVQGLSAQAHLSDPHRHPLSTPPSR